MFGQSLLSAFGIACTTDTDQLFPSTVQATTLATYQLNNATTSIPSNTYPSTNYTVTIGAGGATASPGTYPASLGNDGNDSVFSTITSIGC